MDKVDFYFILKLNFMRLGREEVTKWIMLKWTGWMSDRFSKATWNSKV